MKVDINERIELEVVVDRGFGFGFGIAQFDGRGTMIQAGVAIGPLSVSVEVWPPQDTWIEDTEPLRHELGDDTLGAAYGGNL